MEDFWEIARIILFVLLVGLVMIIFGYRAQSCVHEYGYDKARGCDGPFISNPADDFFPHIPRSRMPGSPTF